MAQGGGLADASIGGEYAQARSGDELPEGAFERHGVTNEAIFDEDAGVRSVVAGIEAQFHFLALEFGPNFQIAPFKADGAILAHDAALAVQEHIGEVLLAWEEAQEGELGQP